ncbi:hypothetical protein, partial [Acidithiobacillus sp.]
TREKTALQGPSANSNSGHDRSTAFYPLPTQSDEEPEIKKNFIRYRVYDNRYYYGNNSLKRNSSYRIIIFFMQSIIFFKVHVWPFEGCNYNGIYKIPINIALRKR